jgi:hypothetical protein
LFDSPFKYIWVSDLGLGVGFTYVRS